VEWQSFEICLCEYLVWARRSFCGRELSIHRRNVFGWQAFTLVSVALKAQCGNQRGEKDGDIQFDLRNAREKPISADRAPKKEDEADQPGSRMGQLGRLASR
jgi:hypothetical protein